MSVDVKEIWAESNLGPWGAKVTISAMTGHKLGRQSAMPHDTLFQVLAEWTGPPAIGFISTGIVNAQDIVIKTSYISALRVARRAEEALRNAQVPDLRKL